MFTVKDGNRSLKFDGAELAHSSSKSRGKGRWVEFSLYRTPRGDYVLSRVGVTLHYHHGSCPVVRRNSIDPLPSETLASNLIPCDQCSPDKKTDELLYPELPRYWAQVSTSPEGVIASLKKYDESGTEYLTDVARRLLEQAAENDKDISDAFYTEWID